MAQPRIIRPGGNLSEDRRRELGLYLKTQWLRAYQGRTEQVDGDYKKWSKAYEGVPLEEIRTVPFYKASNFVVKLIRMFLDTFKARTLNIMFATRPLYVCEGLPQDLKEAWELYINRKACFEWDHYQLAGDLIGRGNKTGTAIIKTLYTEKTGIDVMPSDDGQSYRESPYTYFAGPESRLIPFEDFYVYPITANFLHECEIKFHRLRYIKEQAERLVNNGTWILPDGKDVELYLKHPRDLKREEQQNDAGVVDPYVLEMEPVEAHCKWAITNDSSKVYDIVGLFDPDSGDLIDVYYEPYPRNLDVFTDYRPFPRDELFYGESMAEILGQSQEEASRIHNERRDNSTIASSVCFKRRSGSLIPNPSTNWYPGKVWDLEDMMDLDVINIGRNYDDMIQQEDYVFSLAEKLSGIGEMMQGASQGMLGKRGVYNTGGTISVIAEGNQRQDTNIRDVRGVLSRVAHKSSRLQAFYGKGDPFIDTLPQSTQDAVNQVFDLLSSDRYRYLNFEVKASNAGANAEVEKANLMSMAQVVNQYGQTAVQMAEQLANPQINATVRMVMNDVVNMQKWMAKRLLKSFNEWDAVEVLPDVGTAVEATVKGGSRGTQGPSSQDGGGMVPGGANGALPPLSRGLLDQLSQVPSGNGSAPAQGGMGPGMLR